MSAGINAFQLYNLFSKPEVMPTLVQFGSKAPAVSTVYNAFHLAGEEHMKGCWATTPPGARWGIQFDGTTPKVIIILSNCLVSYSTDS